MQSLALIVLMSLGIWQGESQVRIETEFGSIDIALDEGKAPVTVANFLKYVDAGHYSGGRFHRAVRLKPDNQPASTVKIEVVQAGVARGRERSGFGPIRLERTRDTGLRHLDGVISMARLGPDSATSDFFICVGDQPELDYGGRRNADGQGFAAFGRVVAGMEVVRRIHRERVNGQSLAPPILIRTIRRSGAGLAGQVTIRRDSFGVPHISGRTDAATVFGLMYAQCEDNFVQLEHDLLRATGRAAEMAGEKGVENDRLYRAFEVERLSREEYANLPPRLQALCDAFAAGINYFVTRNLKSKDERRYRAEPWHILAMTRMGRLGGLSRSGVPASAIQLGQRVDATATSSTTHVPVELVELDEGSNMWVIGRSKSLTGNPMLLINPHVGFFGGGQRYEAHLQSDEGLNVYGFAILGTPYIRSGFTANLGWSHTNNYADTVDGYLETFDLAAEPLAYRYGSGYRQASEWEDSIRVKTETGFESRRYRFRRTHHGPIIGQLNGIAVAVRVARLEEGGEVAQRFAMNRARNFVEFRAALASVALTGSNTIYADRAGKIFYVHGNALPRRALGFDWAKPVDGRLIETEWRGYHKLDELPSRLNPPADYLQNCNSTPFLMTGGAGNPVRGRYPNYMVPEEDTARARSSRRILEAQRRFSFDDWTRAATDTFVEEAGRSIEEISAEWEVLKREDEARAEQLKPVLLELKAWDRIARIDSIPATLFFLWFERMRGGAGNDLGIALRGESRTGQVETEHFRRLQRLEEVVSSLERDYNDWHVPWGEVNRLQRIASSGEELFSDHRPSYPVAGGPGAAGLVFTYNARSEKGQLRRYGISGNTFVAVVEFGKQVRARSILVFGQTADPQSPHFLDQAELYSTGRFKPVRFTSAAISADTKKTYQPGALDARNEVKREDR